MSSDKTYAEQAPGSVGVDFNHPANAGYTLEIVDREGCVVVPHPEPRKKFAICGFAASSRMLAPFDDPEWEIWGLNQLYRHIPRETRHFDIHVNWREDNVEGTDHPGWLARCGMPVYMTKLDEAVPTSVRYPIEKMTTDVVGTDYFTSTVAFMLALAIGEIDKQVDADIAALLRTAEGHGEPLQVGNGNAERDADADEALAITQNPLKLLAWRSDRYREREIGIFGIDLIVGTEYDFQKACVEYILGLANARGITVRIPPQSALLRQRWRYGYETEPKGGIIGLNELMKRNSALVNERNQLIARLQTIDGALQENGYWSQVADLRSKGGTVKLNEDT